MSGASNALYASLLRLTDSGNLFDISLPEVRSSAQSVEYFIENSGAALAPTIAGAIAFSTGSKQIAMMNVCITAWILCFFLYLGALFFVEKDIKSLHTQLAERAKSME
jgi:hypothetical protein